MFLFVIYAHPLFVEHTLNIFQWTFENHEILQTVNRPFDWCDDQFRIVLEPVLHHNSMGMNVKIIIRLLSILFACSLDLPGFDIFIMCRKNENVDVFMQNMDANINNMDVSVQNINLNSDIIVDGKK